MIHDIIVWMKQVIIQLFERLTQCEWRAWKKSISNEQEINLFTFLLPF